MTIHNKIAPAENQSEVVDFWNEVLAPKFIRFRHVLQGGLSRHSEAVFPVLPIRSGDRILDVGCGFGDTALLLAARGGEASEVVGMDCCEAFLDLARDDAERQWVGNVRFIAGDVERGVLGGIKVESRVLPYVNAMAMKESKINLKPFFMKVAKTYE